MTETRKEKASAGQRFKAEMREFAFISCYLWVCFVAIEIFKTAVLREQGVAYLPLGVAILKALVMAKFILIGKAVRVGERVEPQVLAHRILWKSTAFLLLLMVFSVLEELVLSLVHGHGLSGFITGFSARPLGEMLAPSVLMLLVLIPLIAFEEIDRALGEGSLSRLLFGGAGPDSGRSS